MDENAIEPEGLSPGASAGSEAAQQPDWVQSNDADGEFGSADSDEPAMAAPDEPAMAMPDEPAAAAPEEEFTGAAQVSLLAAPRRGDRRRSRAATSS